MTARLGGTFLRRGTAVLVFAVVAATLGSAQAAPSSKYFDGYVRLTKGSTIRYTLTLKNDQSSQQTLGSANFTAPPGWSVGAVSNYPSTWNVFAIDVHTVAFRASSSKVALTRGQSISATVSTTVVCPASPDGSSQNWQLEAKQSNDFSGQPGNNFLPLTLDLRPLNSFVFDPIGIQTTNHAFSVTVTAYDACGIKKDDYSAGTLDHTGFNGGTVGPLTWAAGVGRANITATNAETGNILTISDPDSPVAGVTSPTGITQSVSVDVVDILCDTAPCTKSNVTTTVDGPAPSSGKLGLGLNDTPSFKSSFTCGNASKPVGSLAVIDPDAAAASSYGGPITVTVTYKKSVSGNGPASNFFVCLSEDGHTWGWRGAGVPLGPLVACNKTTPVAPCILNQRRTSGGDFQIVLFIISNDPWIGTG